MPKTDGAMDSATTSSCPECKTGGHRFIVTNQRSGEDYCLNCFKSHFPNWGTKVQTKVETPVEEDDGRLRCPKCQGTDLIETTETLVDGIRRRQSWRDCRSCGCSWHEDIHVHEVK